MVLNNRYVELISEGFDMAIRIGELEDSSLRARKFSETTRRMIASPAYIQKFGRPEKSTTSTNTSCCTIRANLTARCGS